jgi:hypothetical protein
MKTASVVTVLMLAASAMPAAQSDTLGELNSVPIDQLSSTYLSCSSAATSGRLDTAAIMQCSVAYEVLKRRAFGGDFEKLLAWSKARTSTITAPPTGRPANVP